MSGMESARVPSKSKRTTGQRRVTVPTIGPRRSPVRQRPPPARSRGSGRPAGAVVGPLEHRAIFLGMPPARPLAELVHPTWATALEPVGTTIAAMGEFLRREVAEGRGYLPAGPHVLRAFAKPLGEVRVLIVGQDPYPTPGHAVGLSFSVAPEVVPIPRSLANIYQELEADLALPRPTTGDLSPWADQGVLLLNRVLTVRPGAPASHRGKGWERVTAQAISALVSRGGPLVAILWGRDARNLVPHLGAVPSIESAHPSPLSAQSGFFGSRPFSRANELLARQGADPIDWRLP
jgi:uracil-DNA glycosylase